MGACLCQEGKPIIFGSKRFDKTQKGYSTSEREILAIVYFLKKFRPYVEFSPVIVKTDHMPAVTVVKNKDPYGRLHRWALELQTLKDLKIEYIKGKENVVADYFSRVANDQGLDEEMPLGPFVEDLAKPDSLWLKKMLCMVEKLELKGAGQIEWGRVL